MTVGLPPWVVGVVAVCAVGWAAAAFLLLAPGAPRVALGRRRPGSANAPGALAATTGRATGVLERMIARRGTRFALLDLAGVRTRPQDLLLTAIVTTMVACVLGLLLGGPLLGLLLAVLVPVGFRVGLGMKVARRRRAFADQLDDSLQLVAGSLRAGHSLLASLNSVAEEAEEPSATEIARVINETRVGRDLGAALDETARRMDNADFSWVGQAIAINREVGGNLAEVLDGVAHTIRERNQIRRQVKALSAEGRMSALVLMLLPVGIAAFLGLTNPTYMLTLTQYVLGWAMIAAAVIMFTVGGLWLRKVTAISF